MDKRQYIVIIGLCTAWLCAVALCFALLQNGVVYSKVSGVVKTYVVEEKEDGSKLVTLEKQPFNRIDNARLLHWDAYEYKLIADHLYNPEYVWSGFKAFFPLFPIVWRFTGLSPVGICLLGFVFFVSGLLLLFALARSVPSCTVTPASPACYRLLVALCMPYMVIFLMPYSESLFFLCISAGLYGLMRNRYWLYFVGFMLGCMTRAAGSILFVAWVIADTLYALHYRAPWRALLRNVTLHLAPVVAGVAAVIAIQTVSGGGNPFAFAEAQQFWGKEWSLPSWPLTGWSLESQSVTWPLLFILFLPALGRLAVRAVQAFRGRGVSSMAVVGTDGAALDLARRAWLVRLLSILFFVGNIVLALFTHKGCMFSQARLLTCTPFFFFLVLDFGGGLRGAGREARIWKWVIAAFMILAVVLCHGMLFYVHTLGSIITLLFVGLVFFTPFRSKVANCLCLGLTLLLNVYWTAYLFNCFLSGGWLFT